MNNETEQIFLLNPSDLQPQGSLQKIAETPVGGQVNLENVEDFSTVCRTCATITEFVIPIFSGEGLQNNLADKIHKHLPIQVTETDSLPRAVCYQCAHTLLAWHELVACCRQAERALRARLDQLQRTRPPTTQDIKPVRNENNQILENQQQKEFEEIARLVVPPPDKAPPSYPATPPPPAPPAPPALTLCLYCRSHHAPADYRDHLIQAHADLLFHCDECDAYVDKKDFILHMSYHVVQYSSGKSKEEPKKQKKKKVVKDENENTETDERPVPSEHLRVELIENDAPIQTCNTKPANIEIIETNKEDDNAFSDHSDTEFDFGPLPESVFEAIEDSQESHRLPGDPTQTPEVIEDNRIEKDTDVESIKYKTNLDMVTSELKVREDDIANVELRTAEETKEVRPIEETVKKHKRSRTCPICGKVYTASSSYFYHMKSTHNKSRDHECELCGRKFCTKVILTQHMSTHSDICENECKICGKKLKSKSSLYIHTQNHIGTKTFSCDQCQISFRWRTHLMRHLKRHSAEKTHKCSTCGRGFTIHCDLLRHIRTHTAGKHECKKCGVSFAQERYLKAHLDKKHSSQVVLPNKDTAPVVNETEAVPIASQPFC